MDEKASTTADTLELLLLDQIPIRAALEELSLWVSRRGSVSIHENVMAALASLVINAEAISPWIAHPAGGRHHAANGVTAGGRLNLRNLRPCL